MKSLKKVAPIMATGLVVAGFGTVDAFAADTVDTPAPPAPPAEVEKQAAPAPSTEIKSVTPTSTETAPDGETKTQGAVNLSVNNDGDVESDGSVTLTTIPDGNVPKAAAPTSEDANNATDAIIDEDTTTTTDSDTTIGGIEDIEGEDIENTTENPDGSTTTDIKGEVTAPPSTPSDTDTNDVKEDVSNIVDKNKNENGSYDWDAIAGAIKDKYNNATVNKNDDGSHSIKFETTTGKENKPLTNSELNAILGETLTPVDGKPDTYTYIDKDGKTVTVTVTDESIETTTTKWTVTVTKNEGDKTIAGSETVDDSIIMNAPGNSDQDTSDSLNVWDILEKIDADKGTFDGINANVIKDKNTGNVTEVKVGNDTYKIDYTPKSESVKSSVDLEMMDIKTIYDLVFAGKNGFTFDNNKIFKNGCEVTINYVDSTVTATYYEITITKTTTGESTDNRNTVAQSVKTEAAKKAVVEALNKALGKTEGDEGFLTYESLVDRIKIDLKNNTWSVENMNYKGTLSGVKATVTVDDKKVDIDDSDIPLADGSAINGSADATVTVEEEIKGTLHNSNTDVPGITADDVNNAKEGAHFGSTGETIDSVVRTDNKVTIQTTITTDGVTTVKTYIFTFTTKTELDPKDSGKKWDSGELPWDENEKAWIFDLNGAGAFVVKQAKYAIICYDSSVYEKDKLLDIFSPLDGNGIFKNCDIRYVSISDIQSDSCLGDLIDVDTSNMDATIEILDGKVYIYGKGGKEDGLSHFLRGPGSITTIEFDKSYGGNSSSQYKVEGAVSVNVEVNVGESVEAGKGSASGVQYGGTLDYSYTTTQPGIEITVSGETEKHRDINVSLNSTPTTPTTPTTPPGGGGTPTTPPGGGGGTTTPTPPPVVDIPEEEPPLVDIPEEEPPLVDIPEEEPPLVDIPEEEPPLVDIPEEQPPLVDIPNTQPPKVTIPAEKVPLVKAPDPSTIEILEEEVPLADVPNTGDTPMGLLAAAAACLSTLGLGILKKRED